MVAWVEYWLPGSSRGVEIRGQADVGGDHSRTGDSSSECECAESGAGADDAIGGGVSHDLLAVGGFEQIVGADFEIAGARVALHTVLLHHEEAIAVDGAIGVDASRSHVALDEVGGLGADLDSRALLDRIAGPVRTEVLVEEIGELDLLIFVTDGVEVGQIVGGSRQSGGTGVQSGKGY